MKMTSVESMTSPNGNDVPNQFIITTKTGKVFQSYSTIIAEKRGNVLTLDMHALDYSKTTSRYLYQFVGLKRKDILSRIEDGTILTKDLN